MTITRVNLRVQRSGVNGSYEVVAQRLGVQTLLRYVLHLSHRDGRVGSRMRRRCAPQVCRCRCGAIRSISSRRRNDLDGRLRRPRRPTGSKPCLDQTGASPRRRLAWPPSRTATFVRRPPWRRRGSRTNRAAERLTPASVCLACRGALPPRSVRYEISIGNKEKEPKDGVARVGPRGQSSFPRSSTDSSRRTPVEPWVADTVTGVDIRRRGSFVFCFEVTDASAHSVWVPP